MKRKLVKQGAATMMVSLPAKWIREHELDKGDAVMLEEQNNDLVISTDKESKKEKKATINLSGFSPLMNRVLVSQYIAGVDEIELTFQNINEMNDLNKAVVDELIGFEVIKQTQHVIIIKDITGTENQEIDALIRRLFFILDSMIEELTSAIENKESLEPVIAIDRSVNKFAYYCLRIMNKQGYPSSNKTKEMYAIITILEQIGDLYKKIAQAIPKKKTISKEQIKSIEITRDSLLLYKELIFLFDKEKIVTCAKNYERIKKLIKGNDLIDALLYQLNDTVVRLNNHILITAFD